MQRPTRLLIAAWILTAPAAGSAQTTERQYLSGTDKDHTVPWDFQVSGGRKAGAWSTIPVPSNWELQGFGSYKYGGPKPRPAEEGRYRHRFLVPRAWRGKRVDLVFEGSMTDTEAWIDGQSVGPKHQGAFYEFRYDVTALLRFGARQQLEVRVAKESSNESVNGAERHSDFWIFGGIYRPVYLEARPPESIERVAIDARHDGAFRMDVHLKGLAGPAVVAARIETADGQPQGEPFSAPVTAGADKVRLETRIDSPKTWTPESPNLYRVAVSLERAGKTAHSVTERFRALADEGIVRTDRDGELDTDGNHAPDGIVGPYREKEASFFAIKEIWSPVYLELGRLDRLPPSFDGRLRVENRYDFTGLETVSFEWRLVRFAAPDSPTAGHADVAQGKAFAPRVAPGSRDLLTLDLPDDWRDADALYLTAKDAQRREIHTWTWMTKSPDEIRKRVVSSGGRASGQETAARILLEANGTRVAIDRATGQLASIERDGKRVSLANGPRIVEGAAKLTELAHRPDGDGYVVEAAYDGTLKHVRWRMDGSGWLELAYRYVNPGRHGHLGVSFDYPEAQVTGLQWLGRGPYRVWKNRIQGTSFDVWQKAYNDTRTGADWSYPEFKGHHADFHWAVLQTKELPITVVTDTEDLFLRVLTPRYGKDPTFTAVPFPEGDVSFLHGIAPIGTKFAGPETLGPESQLSESVGDHPTQHMGAYAARLYFHFGRLSAPTALAR